MTHTAYAPLLIGLATLGLAACGASTESADGKTGWAGIAEEARAEIRKEMATQNLDIGQSQTGVPRAALSPQGDLVIDGKTVAINESQRALLLDFRTQLAGVAEAGAEVGLQGAEIATTAMKEAAKAAFSGDKTTVEERMKGPAEELKASARALCDRLPALLESQRVAAAAVPEFRPYATMDETDIKDCRTDSQANAP